jgi:hypothetical protein
MERIRLPESSDSVPKQFIGQTPSRKNPPNERTLPNLKLRMAIPVETAMTGCVKLLVC